MGFPGQVLVVGGCQKLPPCPTVPMAASFKMDLPLAKDEPSSNSCSASGIADLRRGKSLQTHSRRGVRTGQRNSPTDTRSGRRPSRLWSWASPAAHGEDHYEGSCLLVAHESPWGSRDPLAVRRGPHAGAGDLPEGKCDPNGNPTLEQSSGSTCGPMDRAHAGAGLMTGLVTPWGTHIGAVCSWRAAPYGKDPPWTRFREITAHGKESH